MTTLRDFFWVQLPIYIEEIGPNTLHAIRVAKPAAGTVRAPLAGLRCARGSVWLCMGFCVCETDGAGSWLVVGS